MMKTRCLAPGLLVLLLALSGVAWADDLPESVEAVVVATEAEGLPAEPLRAKAREGMAKGVQAERVVPVLEQLRIRMREADGALGQLDEGEDRGALLHASAMALQAGATHEGLGEAAQSQHRVAAMWCLGDLMGLGVGEADTLRLMRQAGEAGDPRGTYREVVATMTRMQAMGNSPGASTRAMERVMARGNPPLAAIAGQGVGIGQGDQPGPGPGNQ